FSQQKLSDTCVAFLDQLGADAPRPFTAATLQAQAAASVQFVYDGASSPTAAGTFLPGNSRTVGAIFQSKPGTNALSQPNGNAVWVRSAIFASSTSDLGHPYPFMGGNGKPTGFAKAVMAHEEMHKFGYVHPNLENKLGPGYANAARMFGSVAVSVAIMEK